MKNKIILILSILSPFSLIAAEKEEEFVLVPESRAQEYIPLRSRQLINWKKDLLPSEWERKARQLAFIKWDEMHGALPEKERALYLETRKKLEALQVARHYNPELTPLYNHLE